MKSLEFTTDFRADSPFGRASTPRLSILHLMLWTLFSGLHLTVYRAIFSLEGARPGVVDVQSASTVINAIVSGAVFTGAIVLVVTRMRTESPMLRQPGHWLLGVTAVQSLIYLPVMAWMLLLNQRGRDPAWSVLAYTAVLGVSPIAYGFASWYQRTFRWSMFFFTLSLVDVAQCLAYSAIALSIIAPSFGRVSGVILQYMSLQSWGQLLLAACAAIISLGELAAGQRRDWLHWTGVATFVVAASVGVLWMVFNWITR